MELEIKFRSSPSGAARYSHETFLPTHPRLCFSRAPGHYSAFAVRLGRPIALCPHRSKGDGIFRQFLRGAQDPGIGDLAASGFALFPDFVTF